MRFRDSEIPLHGTESGSTTPSVARPYSKTSGSAGQQQNDELAQLHEHLPQDVVSPVSREEGALSTVGTPIFVRADAARGDFDKRPAAV